MIKKCLKCNIVLDMSFFSKDKTRKDGFFPICKKCNSFYKKNYRILNKEKINLYNKGYIKKRRTELRFRENENLNSKKYYFLNKEKINKQRNEYSKNRRVLDPIFKLKQYHRNQINKFLKNDKYKIESIWKYLEYSPQQLKKHLEKQFESWMNWKNYGTANVNKKTWQIDHILPISSLRYVSICDINFKRCWSLDNLRPMESIANIKKGNKLIDV